MAELPFFPNQTTMKRRRGLLPLATVTPNGTDNTATGYAKPMLPKRCARP